MSTNVIIHAIYNHWKQNSDLSISFPCTANSTTTQLACQISLNIKLSRMTLQSDCEGTALCVCVTSWTTRSHGILHGPQGLCDPMDYTVHGILQVRIKEWVVVPFSRGLSQPRDPTQVSCIAVDSLPAEPPGKPYIYIYIYIPEITLVKNQVLRF